MRRVPVDDQKVVKLWNDGRSAQLIAERLGVSRQTVDRALLRAGVQRGHKNQRRDTRDAGL